ncbi:hypothetical protein MNEG_2263 [Monoraphidium neglectum]|uniref:Peroxisome biogenesis protein 22 n=1 Tax=Monoraphidium neglectum TaxID=145388 RepID=A0A0D2NM27_9CHLO|nr:hypothetical protein MNEG_2263 [Monoraphidium neglectum]KIZ05701.1 hypothetical protein MNEG_2263 [Monoraphidium neglectum]|eukprot:XP_013904720.1 hypothetical protein MNEG_2263 [Monoraphidium neglectum]
MINEIRRLLELAWSRLASLLQGAPPGSLQLTGVLGLAALLAGWYHLRGGAAPPRPPAGSSSRAAAGRGSTSSSTNHVAQEDRAARQQQQHQQQAGSDFGWPAQQQQPQQQHAAPAPKRAPGAQAAPAARGGAHPAAARSPLAAAVRAHLAGVKRVTLSAPGVLLEQWEASELSEAASARAEAAAVLREIARAADVYLIAHVPDDLAAAILAGALEAAGVVGHGPGQVPPQRLLLCGTADGKVSVVRQLEPELHIDASARTVGDLSRFVPQLLLIARPGEGVPAVAAAANVEAAASLAVFFNPGGAAGPASS